MQQSADGARPAAKRRPPAAKRRPRARLGGAQTVGVALVLLLAAIRIWDPGPLETLRLKTFDLYQSIKPRALADSPIVIVDVDERSLAELGQWPWPRTRMAALVDRLSSAGVVAIAIDMVFPEPDRYSPAALLETGLALDDALRASIEAAPSNDAVFAEAIARSRVVLGQSGVRDDSGLEEEGPWPAASVAFLNKDPTPYLVQFPRLLRNQPVLEAAAAGRGLFSLWPERDGVVRRVPAVMSADGQLAPGLAIELLRVATGQATLLVRTSAAGVRDVVIGETPVSTDRNGQIWVYFAEEDPSRTVSAADVLAGEVDPARLAGKLVFVGTSAIGLLDLRATPIDAATPGVAVHAQALETVLTGQQLIRPDYALGVEVVMALAAGLFIAFLAPGRGALGLVALGAATAGALIFLSWRLFSDHLVLIDAAFPLLSSLIVLITVTFFNYVREERERSWIRGAFGRYLAPDVVERLADAADALTLGGETRRVSVMFTDVRGFTGVAEAYRDDPQGLIRLMNRFLTPISTAIIERGGTIDKYMGDAVMAFWNAPLDVPDHAHAACAAAIDMRRRLEALNAALAGEARENGVAALRLEIGIGLNTGPAVVGNMGSELRFDYSALGDAVNLASRLEGLTRFYGAPILLGAATAEAVADRLALVEIDRLRVKGKSTPDALFALLGDHALAGDPEFRRLRAATDAATAAIRERRWDAALAQIAEARRAETALDPEFPLRPVFAIYESRVATLRAAPPSAEWDGVFDAPAKGRAADA